MLVVILGSDRALAKHALDRQLSLLDPSGMDTVRIDAASSSADAIFAAVTAAPFFGSNRTIVLQGLLAQASGKSGRGSKAKGDSDLERLVSSAPATTNLIFFDPDLAELNASLKKQLPAEVPVSINEAPRGSALIELARRIADDNGATLDNATARSVLDRLFPAYWPQAPMNRAFDKPPSVEQLESEIAKLALASYPDAITPAIVEEMIPQRSEERTFPLLDAVIGGNQRGALIETDNASRTGEDASRTMAQLYQQIELVVASKAAARPSDPQQAGRALGLANANRMKAVERVAQQARIAPAQQLALALDTDRRMKTGRLRSPEDALVDLVVRVTRQTENR